MRVRPDGMGNSCGWWPVRVTARGRWPMPRRDCRVAALLAMTDRGNGSTGSPRAGLSGRRDCRAALAMTDVPGWLWLPGDQHGSGQAKDCWRVGHGAMLRWACSWVAGLRVVVGLQAIGFLTRSQACISPTAGGIALWFLALILHASGARCLEHGALWQAPWPRGLLQLKRLRTVSCRGR